MEGEQFKSFVKNDVVLNNGEYQWLKAGPSGFHILKPDHYKGSLIALKSYIKDNLLALLIARIIWIRLVTLYSLL